MKARSISLETHGEWLLVAAIPLLITSMIYIQNHGVRVGLILASIPLYIWCLAKMWRVLLYFGAKSGGLFSVAYAILGFWFYGEVAGPAVREMVKRSDLERARSEMARLAAESTDEAFFRRVQELYGAL